jgi:hypothetical protein
VKAVTPVELLRRIHDSFDEVGARDATGRAGDAVASALQTAGRIDAELAAKALPQSFLTRNELRRDQLASAFAANLDDLVLAVQLPLVIGSEEIDSFGRIREIAPREVDDLVYPLPLLEDDIKRALLYILGEPFEQPHSSAELSDIITPRVRLGGRQVLAAFMLKGRGLPGVLRARDAGNTGNQVTKLSRTGVDLFVVQHVNEIDLDVRTQLAHSIAYLRAHGHGRAVGSIWDGAETARLLLAYGLLDLSEGAPAILLPPTGAN